MDMNERKIKILEAIIHDYIQTGDPVGSRTISKKYDLGISSATIRNEMADLEEMGFIVQPHTSSGRIPSDRGYRLYVDRLMECPSIAPDIEQVIGGILKSHIDQVDTLLQETAKIVSLMTNYATIAATPSMSQTKIKHLQLVPVDERNVACVIVTDTHIVKHYVIKTQKLIDAQLCQVLSETLNHHLSGTSLNEMDILKMQHLESSLYEYKELTLEILKAIILTLEEENVPNVYTRGMTNILGFQEFSNLEKAKQILETLEEKPYLVKLLGQKSQEPIHITIGEENSMDPMKQCSVITSEYKIGDYHLGTIGIIGPTRMNYAQVVSILQNISYQITKMIDEPQG
jgi:heat-inducible transcriptional repressor